MTFKLISKNKKKDWINLIPLFHIFSVKYLICRNNTAPLKHLTTYINRIVRIDRIDNRRLDDTLNLLVCEDFQV